MASSCWGRPSALRLSDCDIAPPSLSDFPVSEIQSVVFMQITRLTEITGDITEINLQQREMLPDEATRLSTQLCAWLQELPEELRLYDARGIKLAFYRHSYELHVSYFATIILLEILNSSNGKWRPALSSLVAASCIARLYEEMCCREETAHFLHLHGFLCMVAAVPLICYRHDSEEREITQKEELKVIYSVLRRLRSRYGGSDLVLRKLMSLQQLEDTERRQSQMNETPFNEPGYDILDPARGFPGQLADLFPFPASFCPGMDLLQSDDNSLQDGLFAVPSMSFDNAPDALVHNYFNLADMLLTGYEAFNGRCAKEFEDPFDRQ